MSNLVTKEYQGFEQIKQVDDSGSEFWSARELAPVLEYAKWENFQKVIDRAMLACRNSGFELSDHFPDVRKTVTMPSGAHPKNISDYKLSRYACYLIVQNGDPRKEVIALGQTYFATQTRKQELMSDYFNQLDEDNKRLVIRGEVKQWNQMLAEAAHDAGVILISNLFRISLAEDKMRKENIKGADNARIAHNEVGQEVRKTIQRVNGTLPEEHPTPTKSIEDVTKEQLKRLKAQKTLMLDE
jgi:DNA-damage-inducible protein D